MWSQQRRVRGRLDYGWRICGAHGSQIEQRDVGERVSRSVAQPDQRPQRPRVWDQHRQRNSERSIVERENERAGLISLVEYLDMPIRVWIRHRARYFN